MSGSDNRAGDQPTCAEADCARDAAFWRYDGTGNWLAVCEPHARHLHPSLEIHAWLESGYMRPVERDRPSGCPPEPRVERGRAFREAIDELMEWTP